MHRLSELRRPGLTCADLPTDRHTGRISTSCWLEREQTSVQLQTAVLVLKPGVLKTGAPGHFGERSLLRGGECAVPEVSDRLGCQNHVYFIVFPCL